METISDLDVFYQGSQSAITYAIPLMFIVVASYFGIRRFLESDGY